ncbi:MAG: Na+/H+ antiporter NhaC [Clostridiales bacterium]|nr:Na+/H+ antiporter NhaC [Candidatus Crickella merdequi]
MEKIERIEKRVSLWQAIMIMLVLLAFIVVGVIIYGLDAQIPILLAAVFTTLVGFVNGVKWEKMEASIMNSLTAVLQAVVVLLVIGIMLGTWLQSGVVPSMIYYGGLVISPKFFLPTACLLCSMTSLATGDSWGTAGTVGIALLGIGIGMGMPMALVIGAVISGSYFGDKLSPMSDTTLLASGTCEVNIFEHVKYMLYTTVPSLCIALIAYFFLGLKYANNVDMAELTELLNGLKDAVNISPVLLLAPVFVIAMIILKVPPIPSLMCGALIGSAFAMIFQGCSLEEVLSAMHYGVAMETGNEVIDSLIAGGGLDYVMWTVSLVFCAMILGGIMESVGVFSVIVETMLAKVKTAGGLIATTVVTCIFMNFTASDQYLAILFPSNMYKGKYDELGLERKVLSRTLEDAGTLTSALVPWNTCGAFLTGLFGVGPLVYAPFAILNWMNPIMAIIYGFTGFSIKYKDKAPAEVAETAVEAE